MSSQNPRSPRPRRRIAGERRVARPDDVASDTPTDATPGTTTGTTTGTPADATPEVTGDAAPTPGPAKAPTTGSTTATAGGVAPTKRATRTPAPPQEHDPVEGEPDEEAEGAGRRRGAPGWRLVTLLGVLALVLAVLVGVLALGVWKVGEVREQDAVDEARRTAPAAAERAAAAILSYDHESLDADAKSAGRYMTPSYRKQYLSTFDELVRPNATKVKAVVAADVKASAVTQADPERVSVLLYVNQTTTSTANSGEPQLALNRVQMTMVERDGRWLVSNVTSY